MNDNFQIDLSEIELDEETRAFHLFDLGKKITEVALELEITELEAARHKREWVIYNELTKDLYR
tara:strand:+ start:858 stop:1049 length:192 start_codon:yes stop_codon:yes gene_type:complete